MSKRVIINSDELYWIDVAEYMTKNYKWQFYCWTCSDENIIKIVSDKFSRVVIHNVFDAMRGIPPLEYKDIKLGVLDQDILEKYTYCESIVLKMMDRMSAVGDFLYHERVRLYHRLLSYYLAIVEEIKPDIVIFGSSIPHMVYDYLLYEICKSKEIQTFTLERSYIPGLIIPIGRFENGFEKLLSLYKEEIDKNDFESLTVSSNIDDYLRRLSGNYSDGMPINTEYANKKYDKNRSYKKKFVKTAWDLLNVVTNGPHINYLKVAGRNVEDYPNSNFEHYKAKISRSVECRRLHKHYNSLSKDVDLNKPFIFVALQCQPEKSTSPMGGMLVHQEIMVRLLSECVPEGWYLYVKEHVSQFRFKEPARSKSKVFYDDITKIPNVKVVSLNITSFDLIDNAKASACVTGSVGFESIVRGKPALIFGHAWYKGCEGVFYTRTAEECKNALKKIESGYKVNKNKIRLFCHILDQVGIHGYCDDVYAEYTNISREENATAIAEALEMFVYEESIAE